MRFSIITPSFRQPDWLRLCAASVADQDVPLEHIIQDAGPDEGALGWLAKDERVRLFVEKDSGMYDAVNRGLRRAKGEFVAYLNCDEQYLPGALKQAAGWFDEHPETEMIFGDVIKVDERGGYLSFRKMQTPLLHHTWTCHLSTLTCATFFRRSIIDRGFLFDPTWRSGGDGEWMVRLLRAGVKMGALGVFTSVFTETGENLGASAVGQKEAVALRMTAPVHARLLRPLLIAQHRLRRLMGGMYGGRPARYEIYTRDSLNSRATFRT
jgi:glycosyltransferase involved in cell wall biosynthesis